MAIIDEATKINIQVRKLLSVAEDLAAEARRDVDQNHLASAEAGVAAANHLLEAGLSLLTRLEKLLSEAEEP